MSLKRGTERREEKLKNNDLSVTAVACCPFHHSLLLSWLVDEKRNVYGFQLEEEEKKVFIIVNLLVVPDLKDPEVMTHIGAIKLSSPYL